MSLSHNVNINFQSEDDQIIAFNTVPIARHGKQNTEPGIQLCNAL